jgi:ribosomal-protein-alanine N-acetyltransferase
VNAVVAPEPRNVRILLPVDIDRVSTIESRAYARGWSRGIFADCLRSGYICRGLVLGTGLVGYYIASVAAGESHLLNLVVDPDHQRRGFGRLLLHHAVEQVRDNDAECMFLEVRPSNSAARRLYQSNGFSLFGCRRGYYPPTSQALREDALVLCRRL